MDNQYSNDIISLSYHKDINCLCHTWEKGTATATWEDIKSGFIKYVEFIEAFAPQKILVDERKMLHVFKAEEQKWIENNLGKRILSLPSEKTAIVKSEDIFVEMATDMMMKGDLSSKVHSRFFSSYEDAEEWLLS